MDVLAVCLRGTLQQWKLSRRRARKEREEQEEEDEAQEAERGGDRGDNGNDRWQRTKHDGKTPFIWLAVNAKHVRNLAPGRAGASSTASPVRNLDIPAPERGLNVARRC